MKTLKFVHSNYVYHHAQVYAGEAVDRWHGFAREQIFNAETCECEKVTGPVRLDFIIIVS